MAVLLLVPGFLRAPVGPPEGFTLQEAVDLLTPLVVIPLAWLVLSLAGGPGRGGMIAFLVVAALWVEGQGIHLAANAIGDAFPTPAAQKAFYGTVPGDLDLWLDETLSHWMWHIAWVALSMLWLVAATVHGSQLPRDRTSLTAATAGLLSGVTFFIVTVEGTTTSLGIPATVLLLAWCVVLSVRGLARQPMVTYFLVLTVMTLVGYAGWAALHDWTLPEFSAVGLI